MKKKAKKLVSLFVALSIMATMLMLSAVNVFAMQLKRTSSDEKICVKKLLAVCFSYLVKIPLGIGGKAISNR